MKVKIITHYADYDTEFSGDHVGGEILVNGEQVETFADHYHENRDFIDGFIAGMQYVADHFTGGDIEVEHEYVADGKQVW